MTPLATQYYLVNERMIVNDRKKREQTLVNNSELAKAFPILARNFKEKIDSRMEPLVKAVVRNITEILKNGR
jgi:hypothetical protein